MKSTFQFTKTNTGSSHLENPMSVEKQHTCGSIYETEISRENSNGLTEKSKNDFDATSGKHRRNVPKSLGFQHEGKNILMTMKQKLSSNVGQRNNPHSEKALNNSENVVDNEKSPKQKSKRNVSYDNNVDARSVDNSSNAGRREWHYFPSRFLLPGGAENWRIGFVQSAFSGQLPGQFAKPLSNGVVSSSTRIDGSHFNSENVEEIDRFITNESNECTYILDRDSPPGVREKWYVADQKTWFSLVNRTTIEPNNYNPDDNLLGQSLTFLRQFLRIFYIPILSEKIDHRIYLHILARYGNELTV
ncbi:uncharacterized protein DC041_0006174 [Schistosoma bovis]|uniref:Uncharacterized protein n=1 Tax=Schistosoma bovis TaxID=6184 RepID=A0A430Q3X8_SCHBO|nr:uncharacterized protein DC041_0006174 [Schistosoma bovis]